MSTPLFIGLQRVLDGQGIEIAFTGMFVVFLALAAISLCVAMLPRAMAAIGRVLPERSYTPAEPEYAHDDEAVAAAVGCALDEKSKTR